MKVALLFAVLSLLYATDYVASTNQVIPLETFERSEVLTFPHGWKVRGDETAARTIYRIQEENGNRFLHAHAQSQGIQIGMERTFQPKEFPRLCWRWRVTQLPPGGDERHKETNDSAAGIYVIFDSHLFPRIVKYVWSSTLPVGTRVQNPVYWRLKAIVLRSGPSDVGAWHQETVNFYQDYKELFGREPEEVLAIGLLTSSDETKSVAIAGYDDFTLLTSEAPPPAERPPP